MGPPGAKGVPFGNPINRTAMKTGIHITACNTGSAEKHNRRDKDYLEKLDASGKKTYDIYRDETHLNSSWVNPRYQGRTLPEILEDTRQEVKAKTGRAMQEKATPIREGVCPVRPDTRLSDFQPVVNWFAAHGAAVIRIDLHRDEGHTDAVTGERKHNHHAHLVLDFIDHRTGKSVKLSKQDTSELQTVLAEALHMERGTSVNETGARHLAAQEYREKKAGENLARIEQQIVHYGDIAEQAKVLAEQAQEREAAALAKAAAAEKAASREQFRNNLADAGARVLNVFGRGAVAEAKAERDDALQRAEAAEQQAAADRKAREAAEEASETAQEARTAAEKARSRAETEKAEYGRERYEAGQAEGFKAGRQSVADSIGPLQQQLAEKQATIDRLQRSRDERLDKATAEADARAETAEKELADMKAWNSNMLDWQQSVQDMKTAGLSDEDIKSVFRNGSAIVQVSIKHNYKTYPVETVAKIGYRKTAVNATKHGVWFKASFDNTWHGVRSFLSKALEYIRALHPSKGLRPH